MLGTKVVVYFFLKLLSTCFQKERQRQDSLNGYSYLQEFNLEIQDKKGAKNMVMDHLSQLPMMEKLPLIYDEFPDEHLFAI